MKKTWTVDAMYEELTLFVDETFLDGAVCVGGWNEETFERVLFYKTGYRSFEQMYECEGLNEEEEE